MNDIDLTRKIHHLQGEIGCKVLSLLCLSKISYTLKITQF